MGYFVLIVQWIERQPSKLRMQVQFLLRTHVDFLASTLYNEQIISRYGAHGIMVITRDCGSRNAGSIPAGHPYFLPTNIR